MGNGAWFGVVSRDRICSERRIGKRERGGVNVLCNGELESGYMGAPTKYMHCHNTLYLHTTADQINICRATFHFIYRILQTNSIYALPQIIVYIDNCRETQIMKCNISLYLQTTAANPINEEPFFISYKDKFRETQYVTAKFHFIYRHLQTKSI